MAHAIMQYPGSNFAESLDIQVPVVVADRHVHLTPSVIEQLFCDHYRLHPARAINRADSYLAQEYVTLIGPNGRIPKVRVIGPPRQFNQVEISRADAQQLGVRAPLREPGDQIGSPGITLEGPRTRVWIGTGVICPERRLEMSLEQAQKLHLNRHDRIQIEVTGQGRYTHFDDVLIRIGEGLPAAFHVDADMHALPVSQSEIGRASSG